MALVPCAECRRQVSTLAHSCPACGAPINAGRGASRSTAGLLQRLATVLGAWLVAPWVARTIAAVAGLALLAVMFISGR